MAKLTLYFGKKSSSPLGFDMVDTVPCVVTAESVMQGHPDKLSGLIVDSILDACLAQDKDSRVACEALLTANKVIIAGEIATKAVVDYKQIAEEVIKKVGHSTVGVEFDVQIHTQREDGEE